jgi:hypothetical protein
MFMAVAPSLIGLHGKKFTIAHGHAARDGPAVGRDQRHERRRLGLV